MRRAEIRGQRNLSPLWHRSQSVRNVEQLFCPCGAQVYAGPKPDFARVSCPKCKQVMDVPKHLRR